MVKTIYRVEGTMPGDSRPGSSSASDSFFSSPGPARPPARPSSDQPTRSRRKLLWALVGIAVLTAAMIAVIAVLGASESPAVGTNADPAASTTIASAPISSEEPVGTSSTVTTATTVAEKPASSTTSSSEESTTTTFATHLIADPVRVVIPTLDVDADIVPVGLKNGSEMEVPTVGTVGWYKLGALPGAAGPAVLVSHVSWQGKKGAFYYLKNLKPGDQVEVYDKSGDHAVFQVDSSETILKTKLPAERIWNQTEQSVIRLITCGGAYDSKTGHYLSNVIVYGHLVK
jgi:sortase (surface protein transpeptidase)